jgi:hypothetical protein
MDYGISAGVVAGLTASGRASRLAPWISILGLRHIMGSDPTIRCSDSGPYIVTGLERFTTARRWGANRTWPEVREFLAAVDWKNEQDRYPLLSG